MKILAIDVETTGLSPDYDYITQFGCAIMEDGEVLDAFHTRISPDIERFRISAGALTTQVGNFAKEPAKVADWLSGLFAAPDAKTASEMLAAWAQGKGTELLPVVAHNAQFDWLFIYKRLTCHKTIFNLTPVFGATWIDTVTVARLADPGKRSYNLDAVAERLGLDSRPAEHDALQDAILCGKVFAKLNSAVLA